MVDYPLLFRQHDPCEIDSLIKKRTPHNAYGMWELFYLCIWTLIECGLCHWLQILLNWRHIDNCSGAAGLRKWQRNWNLFASAIGDNWLRLCPFKLCHGLPFSYFLLLFEVTLWRLCISIANWIWKDFFRRALSRITRRIRILPFSAKIPCELLRLLWPMSLELGVNNFRFSDIVLYMFKYGIGLLEQWNLWMLKNGCVSQVFVSKFCFDKGFFWRDCKAIFSLKWELYCRHTTICKG